MKMLCPVSKTAWLTHKMCWSHGIQV
ncbi:hypothetical protein LINGRAHAP2_LOCUS9756 [Linum grandiflorum]